MITVRCGQAQIKSTRAEADRRQQGYLWAAAEDEVRMLDEEQCSGCQLCMTSRRFLEMVVYNNYLVTVI